MVEDNKTFKFGREEKTGDILSKDDLAALVPDVIVEKLYDSWEERYRLIIKPVTNKNVIYENVFAWEEDDCESEEENAKWFIANVSWELYSNSKFGEFKFFVEGEDKIYLILLEENYNSYPNRREEV